MIIVYEDLMLNLDKIAQLELSINKIQFTENINTVGVNMWHEVIVFDNPEMAFDAFSRIIECLKDEKKVCILKLLEFKKTAMIGTKAE